MAIELKYRETSKRSLTRQHSLSREQERQIADQGVDYVATELYTLLVEVSKTPNPMDWLIHPGLPKLNSLIWIWVQMNEEVVRDNIYILMSRKRIYSLNELAKAARLNASFVSRLMSMKGASDVGGWNTQNVFRFATALDARPELMLMVNLRKILDQHVINWQI